LAIDLIDDFDVQILVFGLDGKLLKAIDFDLIVDFFLSIFPLLLNLN
jgi:hypothetical protein